MPVLSARAFNTDRVSHLLAAVLGRQAFRPAPPCRGKLQVLGAQKLSLRERMDPDTINRQMDAAKARWDKSVSPQPVEKPRRLAVLDPAADCVVGMQLKAGKVKSVSAKSAADLLKARTGPVCNAGRLRGPELTDQSAGRRAGPCSMSGLRGSSPG